MTATPIGSDGNLLPVSPEVLDFYARQKEMTATPLKLPRVQIITETGGWICPKLASLLRDSKLFHVTTGLRPSESDDVQVTYFVPYLHRDFHKPRTKFTAALMTHYVPGEHQRRYDRIAKSVDVCVTISQQHTEYLQGLGCCVHKVQLPLDKQFFDAPLLRLLWPHRSPEGYGRRKRTDLLEGLKRDTHLAQKGLQILTTGGALSDERLRERMLNCDGVLVTSDWEAGPACVLEALALGKYVFAPAGVGLVDEYAINSKVHTFERGNLKSLQTVVWDVLRGLYSHRQAVLQNTKEEWIASHDRIFSGLIRGDYSKPTSRV